MPPLEVALSSTCHAREACLPLTRRQGRRPHGRAQWCLSNWALYRWGKGGKTGGAGA